MSLAEMMATPLRTLDPPALGLETTLHLVPFHCSISACSTPLAATNSPTAQTSVVETAATASRLSCVLALGLETMLQLVPSQCSISVCIRPPEVTNSPTAQMSLAETAVTPASSLVCVLALGLETTLQLVPSQCSIRVCAIPEPVRAKVPTAQTSVVETATTPRRTLPVPAVGLATTLHFFPSQCSMSACMSPLAVVNSPTAHTSVALSLTLFF